MDKKIKIALMALFVFGSMSVLSFAQDAAPSGGAGTTQQTIKAKGKKALRRDRRKHRAPKRKKVNPTSEVNKDNNNKGTTK